MSLLDDVSIVVTPNGYKAGELYAVVPVPTEGAEKITNGDFSNGLTGWTENGGSYATIVSGALNSNNPDAGNWYAENISQNVSFVNGTMYKVTFKAKNISGGLNLRITHQSHIVFSDNLTSNFVDYTVYYIAQANNDSIRIFCNSAVGEFQIDDISLKEYTAADMDVTRATAATRVDENGLVNYAEIIGSELVTNGDFSNGTTDWEAEGFSSMDVGTYQGKNNVLNVNILNTATISRIRQPFDYVSGVTYLINVDVYLVSGNFRVDSSDSFVLGNFVSTNTTGSWQTLTAYITASGTGSNYIWLRSSSQISQFYISNISVKEVTRDNVPRIDYTGGGCPHILSEPQRTNTVTYSEDFSQFSTSGSPTLTTGQLAPDGTLGATKVSGTIGSTYLSLNGTTSATATRTIYAKTVSGTGTARLMSYFGNTDNLFNLTEEWQRFELTGAISTGAANFYVDMRGTQTLNEFIVWGGQSEEATYATSYIPTSGSTVTRNQDIFTRDGIGSLINDSEGVLFVELKTLFETGTFRQFNLSKDNSNRIYITKRGDNGNLECRMENPSGNLNFSFAENTTNDFVKVAFRYGLNNFAVFIDGVNKNVTATGNVFASGTLNTLEFDSPLGQPFFGKVKQLQVYNTALTDAQLTSLTS